MPKIDIQEIDLTTPGSVIESTDVVFIPGFVDASQSNLKNKQGEYIGLGVNEPHLFTDLNEFKALCGEFAPVFTEDQRYSDVVVGGKGFEPQAIPDDSNDIMIKKGTLDPSYVMAKELLSAGLSVVYQRVNEKSTDETITKVEHPDFKSFMSPEGANTVYDLRMYPTDKYLDVRTYYNNIEETYYVIDGEIIAGSTIEDPSSEAQFKEAVLVKVDNAYIPVGEIPDFPEELPESNDDNEYEFAIPVQITSEPGDWKTGYTNYFERKPLEEDENKSSYVKIQAVEQETVINSIAFNVKTMYSALSEIFSTSPVTDDMTDNEKDAARQKQNVSGLIDKGNISVKYLTSGGYPVFECSELAKNMLEMAAQRGDCVALIDHTDFATRELNPYKDGSLYSAVKSKADTTLEKGEFGAMFTPWATFSRSAPAKDEALTFRAPGSFAYLLALADSIKTNANWLAIAGAARGGIKNLSEMTVNIPNGVADTMQPRDAIAVNAITNIKPYGYTIWGNRTLKKNVDNLVATSFLNIRNLISDVKKTCYRVARKLTFEQETDVLWINFKSEISKLLDRMKSGYGISGYKIVRDLTHDRANDKATLCAKVILYPTYAVEDFYITIVLKDDEIKVD